MSQTDGVSLISACFPIDGEPLGEERALYRQAIVGVTTKKDYSAALKDIVKELVPSVEALIAQTAADVTYDVHNLLADLQEWQDAIDDDQEADEYQSPAAVTLYERRIVAHWLVCRGVVATEWDAVCTTQPYAN